MTVPLYATARSLNRILVVCVLCVGLSTAGCSSMKTVRVQSGGSAPFGPIKAGDEVSVLTRDGHADRFVVAEIAGDEIVARSGNRYHRNDLVKLERKTFSPSKTALLSIGICLGAALVTGVIFAAMFD
jgi:hypothetical protein